MKHAEIHLGMFKQGDDLAYHVQHTNSAEDAFREHASQMNSVAEHLKMIAEEVKGCKEFEIDAGTHYIGICGPDELINRLIKKELACEIEYFDEEECDAEMTEDFDEEDDCDNEEMSCGS